MNKLVSIIIPTYARPENLCRAIDSVLSQTYSPIEIIVVDDNGIGTDYQLETEQLLSDYIKSSKIVYLKHEVNKNGAAARNTGVKHANGFFVGLLDDDDVFENNKIELQVRALESAYLVDSSCRGCYCNIAKVSWKKTVPFINPDSKNIMEDLLMERIQFNSSTMLFHRDAFLELGGFDERFRRHQDWEFSVRFLSMYNMILAAKDTTLVRKYGTSTKIGNIQETNLRKFIDVKEMFLKELAPYIDVSPQADSIYHYQWMLLSCNLFQKGFWKLGLKYYKKALQYQSVTIKDNLRIFGAIARYYKYKFF